MSLNHYDIEGEISVTDFSITLGTGALSSDKQSIVLNYTGYAYPEKTDVEISVYEYSLDNGTTWSAMTPSISTVLTSLTFSESGTAHTFEWESKEDEGMDFYNTNLRVRLRGISGLDDTGLSYGSYLFERAVQNLSTISVSPEFPDSYSGISGSDLTRQLAPRLQ